MWRPLLLYHHSDEMADEAVNKIRAGDAGVATLKLNEADEIELVDFTEAGETVGAVASALGADQLCFVYGAVLLDETKGGLDVASDSLARRKLVLVTSVGSDLPPRDRGAVSEKRLKLRAKLPDPSYSSRLGQHCVRGRACTDCREGQDASGGRFMTRVRAVPTRPWRHARVQSAAPPSRTPRTRPNLRAQQRGGGRRLVQADRRRWRRHGRCNGGIGCRGRA